MRTLRVRECCGSCFFTGARVSNDSPILRAALARAVAPGAPALAALSRKYRTLAELRAEREHAVALGHDRFAGAVLAARGRAFRAMASEFPGALRELEVTATAMLRRKAERVEAASASGHLDPWIPVVWDFHAMLRELLALRRFLRAQPGCSAEAFCAYHAQLADAGALIAFPATAREAIERPPNGRMLALVWPALAARYGLSEASAREHVFGPLP